MQDFRKFVLAATLTVSAAAANAGLISTTASLDGAQASAGAGTGSTATGMATLLLDTAGLTLDLSMTVSGISLADITLPGGLAFGALGPVHIHAAPAGANGSIIVPFPAATSYTDTADGFMLSVIGLAISQADLDAIASGDTYLNVHTSSNPGGEIRGQIAAVPEPATLSLLGIGMLLIGLVRTHPASGISALSVALARSKAG